MSRTVHSSRDAETKRMQSLNNNSTIDRAEVSRALAKAIAYKQCGKDMSAEAWAYRLIELLQCAAILNPEHKPIEVTA